MRIFLLAVFCALAAISLAKPLFQDETYAPEVELNSHTDGPHHGHSGQTGGPHHGHSSHTDKPVQYEGTDEPERLLCTKNHKIELGKQKKATTPTHRRADAVRLIAPLHQRPGSVVFARPGDAHRLITALAHHSKSAPAKLIARK